MSNERRYLPLTHPQQGIWYTDMMFPGTSISIVAGTARIKGNIDFGLLERAINRLIEKNDAFRIRLVCVNGQVKQYISEYAYRKIDFVDFSQSADPIDALFKWDAEQTKKPFELYDSDLAYFAMMKISEQEGAFYAKTHHIVSDAWTMSIVVNQVLEFYSILRRSEPFAEEEFPSYEKFIRSEAEYINSDRFAKDQEYWISKLDPLPEMTALKTRATSEIHTSSKRKTMLTPLKFSTKLREYCKEHGTTPYSLFLAAIAMYINRITAKKDIVIGSPVLNRSNKEERRIAGMFINTLPIRINIDSDMDFLAFSNEVQLECLSLLRHQKYPHDLLLKDIRSKYNNFDKLYDIVLSYQNSKMLKSVTEDEYSTRWHFNHHQVNSLTIHINDRDDDGRLIIDYDFHDDLYHVQEIEFLHKHMLSLLWHALDNPKKEIKRIEMLPEFEKKKIIYEFNDTEVDYRKDQSIPLLFEKQVEKTPDHVALVFDDRSMTYEELNNKANQIAHMLRDKGTKPESVVALMLDRSFEVLIGILGILKAGCAFLPIDPEYPDERIRFMLENSNTGIVITQSRYRAKIAANMDIIDVDNFDMSKYDIGNPGLEINPCSLAYIIYTSGSTGKPKGAMIEHRNLVNFVRAIGKIMDYSVGNTVLSMTTISFDIFIFETIPSLLNGLRVVIANREQQVLPKALVQLISKHRINKVLGTPSRIQALIKENEDVFRSVDEIMVGGDVFPSELLYKLRNITKARILNGYGPTETTIGVTFKVLTDTNKINIGRPLDNIRIYILDKHMNPVPIGIPGELYIGGAGVGRGYINNPVETESRFKPNPFVPSELIYASGDLARWYPKGEIEFLGRIDHQVKIRGLRIELPEIENQLTRIEGIHKAIVTVRDNGDDNKALCAYYTADREIPPSDVRKTLSRILPNYMIPNFYLKVDVLPYTPSGKVDIKRLPPINAEELTVKGYVAPRNETEVKLAKAWEEVLNLSEVGIDHNFFELGGDSLAVIMLQVKLFEHRWNIKTQDIYNNPTIRELSARIAEMNSEPAHMDEGNHLSSFIESMDEAAMDKKVSGTSIKRVLLIGATGFLGVHILDSLLCHTDCVVYCIVRGNDDSHSVSRLREIMAFYFPDKHKDVIGKRVFVVKGDITRQKLGLSDFSFNYIEKYIDAVIDSAALVKYYGDYSEFEKVNVIGTRNAAEFARKNGIPFYYISTLGLSGQYLAKIADQEAVFTENDLHEEHVYMNNVYIRSKYKAEMLINHYIASGLKATIFRVGNLTGRYSDGKFQRNIDENSFYNIMKSIITIGAVSNNIMGVEFNLTPVDLCSRVITKMMFSEECIGKTFHVFNHNILSISSLLDLFRKIGIDIKEYDAPTFRKVISQLYEDNEKRRALRGIVNDINEELQLDFGPSVRIGSDFTKAHLDKLDFNWPDIDADYLGKLYDYMKKAEFLN